MIGEKKYFEDLDGEGPASEIEFTLQILATSYENVPMTAPAKETGQEFVLRTLDFVEDRFDVNGEEWFNKNAPGQTFDKQFYLRALAIAWLCCQSAAFESNGIRDGAWEYALRAIYHAATMQAHVECVRREIAAPVTAIRNLSKKANDVRHKHNRETAALIEEFYLKNHEKFLSLDAAAESAIKVFPVSFRTARKHIGAAKKLRFPRSE